MTPVEGLPRNLPTVQPDQGFASRGSAAWLLTTGEEMALGPGKYDFECEATLIHTHADAVILLVFGGDRGSGFSVTIDPYSGILFDIPSMLRFVADDIEKSYKRDKPQGN